ncbi:DUF1622 domain-containing protein [Sedimentibacter hydroxybenzoicus DSM 7310]|uniref:DUF1622 domain-containing protein n=1 Tax=Sedimentibacter hydroxybenzoicus DSM 7310 TaxID=1123245 RepID=A0A974GXL3_SEDHY|nr:DUF1622 domain-containing protein [Sedimentibacter hydroxybenzoicus]NYB75668.1 DUF1622 domain-containing protein [Sedimentibacter hydroxybenzoicus DSM 7310]
MLEHLISIIVPNIAHILELIGVFIVIYSALKTFGRYAIRFFNFSDETIKIEFSQALAMALEFKLGAEILKTLVIRTIDELIILASIVVLRAALTLIIHWEIESDSKRCNHFLDLKKFNKKNEEESSHEV